MSRRLLTFGAVPRHHFADVSVIFCSNSGRTHAIDRNAIEVIDLIQSNEPIDEHLLVSTMAHSYPEDNEELLSQYVRDIISNLIELEIICEI